LAASEYGLFPREMPATRETRIAVLLVGLPGLLEGVLRRELRGDPRLVVQDLVEHDVGSAARDLESVLVVGADAASLRQATSLSDHGVRVLATIAVTGEEPIGDMYLISPAGRNVSPAELVQAIRDAATTAAPRPVAARMLS
jgi:hypothetical protein